MSEVKKTLELLPKGQFVIHQAEGKFIKGRFSMFVLDRFCESKSIPNYLVLLEKILAGMSVGDYADLILVAVDDYHRNNDKGSGMNRAMIMDMIDDDLDGISSESFDELIRHAIGRIANVKKLAENAATQLTPEQEQEKKSDSKSSSTGTISDSALSSAG